MDKRKFMDITGDVIVAVIVPTGVAVPLTDQKGLRPIVAAQEFTQLSNPIKQSR